MNGHHVLHIHELELVDATDAVVRQHQRAWLDEPLLVQVRVLHHAGREPGSCGALARREDGTGQELRDPAQQLALARGRVAEPPQGL